ncbi:hypothetical protein C8R46DRAFT_901438, partial [Mycena filopes]
LLLEFEGPTHFKTYAFERNPSLSNNCHCIRALLTDDRPHEFRPQIVKLVKFITKQWAFSESPILDKWSTSSLYSAMATVIALVQALHLCRNAQLDVFPADLPNEQICLLLLRITAFTLHSQHVADGSWGTLHSNCEETAYGVIILAHLASLAIVQASSGITTITEAIERGREYLRNADDVSEGKPLAPRDFIWTGKVTYAVRCLRRAYIIGAMYTTVPRYPVI